MSDREPTPVRRAALLLHGLPPAHQEQVLSQLDDSARASLRPLLRELAGLGLAGGGSGAAHAMLAASRNGQAPSALPPVEQRAALLGAEQVAESLQACSPLTVARLLQARPWPWRDPVLALMPPARREAVERALQVRGDGQAASAIPPGVLDCWCERLCQEAQRPARRRRWLAWLR